MFNIVIFSGGTGSVAIQEGFFAIYGNDNYNLDIIINAYDNGKSTGICRKIFNNKILGASDLRKNHMTQFKIQKASALKDSSSRESNLYQLFNLRFDAESKEAYHQKACELLEEYRMVLGDKDIDYLKNYLIIFSLMIFITICGDQHWIILNLKTFLLQIYSILHLQR